MRKFLDQKLWSHGTLLGSMWTLFSKPLPKIFRHIYFLVVLRVIKHPLVAALMVDFLFTGLHWGHLWVHKFCLLSLSIGSTGISVFLYLLLKICFACSLDVRGFSSSNIYVQKLWEYFCIRTEDTHKKRSHSLLLLYSHGDWIVIQFKK